jgi:hypothetical protein
MKKLLICSLFVLCTAPLFAQLSALVQLTRSSALTIFVETNIMNFSLVQKGDNMLRAPVAVSANVQKNKLFVDHNKLDIEVKGFKSDNLIGQREFYKLMKVDQFPRMNIELLCFEANTECRTSGMAVLNITITNVTRKYEFPVVVDKNSDLIRIVGKKRISITDFGLSAPTNLLFGMAKVNEQIVIDLNLQCKYRLQNEEVANR